MGRMFVVDPICSSEVGHNLNALKYFGDFFTELNLYHEVLLVASDLLPAVLGKSFIRDFHYCYNKQIPQNKVEYFAYENGSSEAVIDDILCEKSFNDIGNLIRENNVSSDDCLFYPSADYYSMQAVLRQIKDIDPASCPSIHFRLIGVLESVSRTSSSNLDKLKSLIDAIDSDVKLGISAETPKYATFLSDYFKKSIFVTPYPLSRDLINPYLYPRVVVSFPGAQRFDKGFLRIPNIIVKTLLSQESKGLDGMDIYFLMQNIHWKMQGHCLNTINRLTSLPGVLLLPPSLSSVNLARYMAESRVFVLPYESHIYNLRGSAILMEAISMGRTVIAQKGTAFEEQIRYYNAGYICDSDEEYAEAIIDVCCSDVKSYLVHSEQVLRRISIDSMAVYKEILQ